MNKTVLIRDVTINDLKTKMLSNIKVKRKHLKTTIISKLTFCMFYFPRSSSSFQPACW